MRKLRTIYLPQAGHYLALAALMALMVIPFMMNRRVGPQTGFVIESTSVILALLLVLGVALMGRLRQAPPVISVMFASLALWVVVQARFLQITWLSQVDLAASILLVTALVTWAVSAWQQYEQANVLQYLAWGLIIGVLLQSVVMWMQYFGLTQHFHGYVSYSQTTNIMGQLGQRNHLGHYLMWGMVAVLYLRQSQVLHAYLSAALIAWIGLSMGLIGSRTLLTYLLAIGLLACVWRMKVGKSWQNQWYWVVGALFWVFLVQWGLEKVLSLFSQAATTTGMERLVAATEAGKVVDPARNVEWLKAWQSFLNSPIWGHGWASGSLQSFWLHSEQMVSRRGVLFTHSHNSVLQLLMEMGVVGVLWLVVCFGILITRCFKHAKRPESFAILALATVSVCHSLLEYPLWYVYFLIPFALFWALVPNQNQAWSLRQEYASSRLNIALGLVGILLLAGTARLVWAYNDIVSVYGVAKNETAAIAIEKKAKIHALLEREYLLDYYVQMALLERSFNPYTGTWSQLEADNAKAAAVYRPYPSYAIKWGLYEYRSGNKAQAQAWLNQVWRYYPNQMNGTIKQMQTSPYYVDLWPQVQTLCEGYQKRIKIQCGQ